MLFMVVEQFAEGKASEIYRIAREEGRRLPDGLRYGDSWVAASFDVCFQLMECDDLTLMQEWVARWEDLGVSRSCRPSVRQKRLRSWGSWQTNGSPEAPTANGERRRAAPSSSRPKRWDLIRRFFSEVPLQFRNNRPAMSARG